MALFGVLAGLGSIFTSLPTPLKLLTVAGLFLLDSAVFDLTSAFTSIFYDFIGLKITAFFLFVLLFVAALINIMYSSNKWFGSG